MSQPETIDTVAFLALRPEPAMSSYVNERLGEAITLTPRGGLVIEDKHIETFQERGCPAAGYVTAPAESEDRVLPLPIFQKFVPWAAKITLLSDEWNASGEGDSPLTLEK